VGGCFYLGLEIMHRTIGVCPQQNVLFNYLTVKEHLELFASLKGVPKLYVDEEVQDMVTRLGLQDKLHARASNLSGGMKRKLQVSAIIIIFHQLKTLKFITKQFLSLARKLSNLTQKNSQFPWKWNT
jgi:ABC-type Na+ transport system ATPase subunit NatA